MQGPSGLDVAYTYDSAGRMMTRTSGGVTTRFTWDAWDCVRETTGTDDTVYHIPNGVLQSFSLNGTVYQVHMDALSSVRMITDPSGNVVARMEYGAYGEEIFVSAIPALANFPYRFVGALGVRTDTVTGLYYMRNRWYDASLQRFISRDPIGLKGGVNLYNYAYSSPTNFIDPWGRRPAADIYRDIINDYAGRFTLEGAYLNPKEGCGGLNLLCHLLRRISNEADSNEDFLTVAQALFVPNSSVRAWARWTGRLSRSTLQGGNGAFAPGMG